MKKDNAISFIESINRICQNKEAKCELKKDLSFADRFKKIKYLGHLLGNSKRADELLIMISTWIAKYQNHSSVKTLGENLRQAANTSNNIEAFEKRVDKLISMSYESLVLNMESVLRRCSVINYIDLIYLLDGWESPDKWAQNELAKKFYKIDLDNSENLEIKEM